MKAAFLDRDGTIVADYPDNQWPSITNPEFLPGALAGLKAIQSLGYELIIVSNQYLIDEGFISQQDYDNFTLKFKAALATKDIQLLDIFYCPHRRDAKCQCLKPRPGLIHQALRKYPEIVLSDSFLVGDSSTDSDLAVHFGLRSFSLGFSYVDDNCQKIHSLREIPKLLLK